MLESLVSWYATLSIFGKIIVPFATAACVGFILILVRALTSGFSAAAVIIQRRQADQESTGQVRQRKEPLLEDSSARSTSTLKERIEKMRADPASRHQGAYVRR